MAGNTAIAGEASGNYVMGGERAMCVTGRNRIARANFRRAMDADKSSVNNAVNHVAKT